MLCQSDWYRAKNISVDAGNVKIWEHFKLKMFDVRIRFLWLTGFSEKNN